MLILPTYPVPFGVRAYPERRVVLGGRPLTLAASPRAWYACEISGASLPYTVGAHRAGGFPASCLLLWALSSADRDRKGLLFGLDGQEKEDGWSVPGDFLELFPSPVGPEWPQLTEALSGLLEDSGFGPNPREVSPPPGSTVLLCANNRAWYAIEKATQRPFPCVVQEFLDGSYTASVMLYWAFAQSHLARHEQVFAKSQQEKRDFWMVPGAFLDCLAPPWSREWAESRAAIYSLLEASDLFGKENDKKRSRPTRRLP